MTSSKPSPLMSPAEETLQPARSPGVAPRMLKPKAPRLPRSTIEGKAGT
jgi:hypothetical protein